MTQLRQPPPSRPWRLAVIARTAAIAVEIEETLARMVAGAREGGHNWQEIGDALGVSRQGAYQRYGKGPDVCPQDPSHGLNSHAPGGSWYGVGHHGQPSPWPAGGGDEPAP